MKIYRVTIYNWESENTQYENYFTAFKKAKKRILWQLQAYGIEKQPRKWPKKPCGISFHTGCFHIVITIHECNQEYTSTLGSWIGCQIKQNMITLDAE